MYIKRNLRLSLSSANCYNPHTQREKNPLKLLQKFFEIGITRTFYETTPPKIHVAG